MGVFTDHPHTAITIQINAIIERDLEPEVELPELLEIIKLQYSGAIEAARAIRKKLKYGTLAEQLKSLDLLNALVCNGGRGLTELYNDRKLLDRLRESATNTSVDIRVRKKIILLAIAWNEQFSDSKWHGGIVKLKSQLPKVSRKKPKARRDFMNDEADDFDNEDDDGDENLEDRRDRNISSRRARTEAEANRKYKIPTINLKKEGPKIKMLIADASSASTDLTNALKGLDRTHGELATDNRRATVLFDKARAIRRKILRYLQLTSSEEFLGSLIHANEELVAALQQYTEMSAEHDSDDYSDLSDESGDSDLESVTDSLASSMISDYNRDHRAPPPAPTGRIPSNSRRPERKVVRDDDPFGDANEVDEDAGWR